MVRSQKSQVLLALAAFFCCIALATANTCTVSVSQSTSSSWNDGGSDYTAVNAVIKNSGSSAVKSLTLSSSANFDSAWSIVSSNGKFSLPEYVSSIAAGDSFTFGYIVKSASPASFTVESAECDGSVGSTPPATSNKAPTSAPSCPTATPTNPATQAPTEKPTEKPTTAPTTKPSTTTGKSSSSSGKSTTAPTTKPTTKPTTAPTTKPTTKPTTAPTTKPTTAPTTKPTTKPSTSGSSTGSSGSNGRLCSAGQIWSPAPGTTWQWQLTGTIDTSFDVQMYDIDLFDNTAATIANIHTKGAAVICYFSTQYEDWRPDAAQWPSSVLGSNLDDWPGERYVDIRSSIVRGLIEARLDLAVSKGCDGVEPDNVDGYQNSNGLSLTAADQLNFNNFLAQAAHARGLSVGLKNDLDQVKSLQPAFDWALDEQCNQYGECSSLTPFVTAGKAVFGVEYTGTASKFCPTMVTQKFSWLLKDLSLSAKATQCCTYASGGCATKPAYTCKAATNARSIDIEEEAAAVQEAIAVDAVENVEVAQAEFSAASVAYPAVALVVVAAAILF